MARTQEATWAHLGIKWVPTLSILHSSIPSVKPSSQQPNPCHHVYTSCNGCAKDPLRCWPISAGSVNLHIRLWQWRTQTRRCRRRRNLLSYQSTGSIHSTVLQSWIMRGFAKVSLNYSCLTTRLDEGCFVFSDISPRPLSGSPHSPPAPSCQKGMLHSLW